MKQKTIESKQVYTSPKVELVKLEKELCVTDTSANLSPMDYHNILDEDF